MNVRITIIDIFNLLYPCQIVVYLVKKEIPYTMSIQIVHQFSQGMGTKPQIIERDIECLRPIGKRLLNVLQQQGGLAHTACTFDSNEPFLPINLNMQITLVLALDILNQAIICR